MRELNPASSEIASIMAENFCIAIEKLDIKWHIGLYIVSLRFFFVKVLQITKKVISLRPTEVVAIP